MNEKTKENMQHIINAMDITFNNVANGSLYKNAVQEELDRIEGVVSAEYFDGFEKGLEEGYRSMASTALDMVRELRGTMKNE